MDGPVGYRCTGGFSGVCAGPRDVDVDLDGVVTRAWPDGRSESAMLDGATLADLHTKINQARFRELAPMYTCDCADDFVYEVSAQIDGTLYAVEANDLSPMPEQLRTVIHALAKIGELPLDWH